MTNKPMLSVELLELLNRVVDPYRREPRAICLHNADIAELRALLDKPVLESKYEGMTQVQVQAQAVSDGIDEILHGKPAIQQQGNPVGWQFFQDGKWWNGFDTNNHRANTEGAGLQVRDVYADQSAPVAVTHTMWSVMEAAGASKIHTVLTSGQCSALADALNEVKP